MGRCMKKCYSLIFICIFQLFATLAGETKVLKIASTLPLEGEGKFIQHGIEALFKKVNDAGGVKGYKLEFVPLDDHKSKSESIKKIKANYDKTPIFLNIFTTGVVQEILPLINEKKVLAWGPEDNSMLLRNAQYKYVVHTKPGLDREIEALVDYSINNRAKWTFGIFYEDSDWGVEGAKVAREVIERFKKKHPHVRLLAEVSHPRGTVDIEGAAKIIGKKAPESIICIARRHATYNFVIHAINLGLFRSSFMGVSYLQPIAEQLQKARGVNFISTAAVPDYKKDDFKISVEYRNDFKKYFPNQPLSVVSFASYVNAAILVEMIKNTPGEFSLDSLIAQVEATKDYNFQGLKLDFNFERRRLLSDLWVSAGYNEEYIVANGFQGQSKGAV